MTTFLGAGLSSFGTSYAGYGNPAETILANKTIFIDEFGRNGNVRLIDPVTMDYKFNDKGNIVGGDGVQQKVYLALFTIKNSSSVANFGQSFTNVKVISNYYESLIINEVNDALKHLVDSNEISISKIDVNRIGTNRTLIHIVWKNLINNIEYINTIKE